MSDPHLGQSPRREPWGPARPRREPAPRRSHRRTGSAFQHVSEVPALTDPVEGAIQIWVSHLDEDTMVTVRGDVDLGTSGHLVEVLGDAFKRRTGGRRLLLDVTGIEFIDSTGVCGLDTTRSWIEMEGGELVLIGHSPSLTRLLRLMGLLDNFRVIDGIHTG